MHAPHTVTSAQVIDAARTWVGVPFRHQGRARSGIDCLGLPIVVLQQLGVLPPRFEITNYGRLPSEALAAGITRYCTPAPKAAIPGTLIAIAWAKLASHVAICTGPTLIHAYERIGGVVEHGYRSRWLTMTHSAWRLPGVVYDG